MSEDTSGERMAIIWSPEARSDLRAIERETAMQILSCVDRYLASRTGARPIAEGCFRAENLPAAGTALLRPLF